MNSETPVLKVSHVCAGYGRKRVVEDVSLDISGGQVFGLLGLNGTGKTTLIKTLVALKEAESGEIVINGLALKQSASRHAVAYLPERFEPPWFLSGAEFVRFSLRLYGRTVADEELFAAAKKIDLDPGVLKQRVQTYSKGMRQKLGLLATFLTRCPLLILDEPMSGLDPQARYHVKQMIMDGKAAGQAIFLSSHILADIEQICDQVAVMNRGRLVFGGTPAEMMKKAGNDNIEEAFLSFITP